LPRGVSEPDCHAVSQRRAFLKGLSHLAHHPGITGKKVTHGQPMFFNIAKITLMPFYRPHR
jgi:hypothetical protein